MNIKVIYSAGGVYEKNSEEKIADDETVKTARQIVKALKTSGHRAGLIKISPSKISAVGRIKSDVVFNLCEWSGRDFGLGVAVLENLEKAKIKYTGASSKNYIWCCNKVLMKKMFESHGIPTPNWVSISPGESERQIVLKIKKLKFPLFIKPAYEHCSIGVDKKSVLKNLKEASNRINLITKKYNQPAIVEEFIEGREFTITIVEGKGLNIFVPDEVIFRARSENSKLISFNAKWSIGETYDSVTLKKGTLATKLKKLAKEVFLKMKCKGYIRVDVRFRRGKIYVLEVNVNPSLLPEDNYGLTVSTTADGWSFEKLVGTIAHSALR